MRITGADGLHKVVVLNPKGGCGKTTLATNLASCCAHHGMLPALVDCDPQGFSLRWLEKRPGNRPRIQGIQPHAGTADLSAVERPSRRAGPAIFDLPAAIPHEKLHHYTYAADALLIPVMPSAMDVHSAARLVAELLLDAQIDRRLEKVAIVANRVRANTRSHRMLARFLGSLEIPMIAVLRDSQNYVYASERGIGVCELPAYRSRADAVSLETILQWLSRRRRERAAPARDRAALIAEAAYRRAERRGFQGGSPEKDWLEAEREVDSRRDE